MAVVYRAPKIPWYLRIVFMSISVLSFYFVIASGNIVALAGLGITGLIGALDLVEKGIELIVESIRFLESEIRQSIIIKHLAV